MIPPPPGDLVLAVQVPDAVREKLSYGWWSLLILLVAFGGVTILSGDLFGAIFALLMASVVWYMVSDKCRHMSQYWLLLFGLMCAIEVVFETIALCLMIGGRTISQHQVINESLANGNQKTTTITTVSEVHPFFDKTMGYRYNIQSLSRILSVLLMAFGAFLAYWSYSAFPTGLFEPLDGDEIGPVLGRGQALGNYGVVGADQSQEWRPGSSAQGLTAHGSLQAGAFEGTGRRLGSG